MRVGRALESLAAVAAACAAGAVAAKQVTVLAPVTRPENATAGAEPDPTEGRSLFISRHSDGTRTFRGELDAMGGGARSSRR